MLDEETPSEVDQVRQENIGLRLRNIEAQLERVLAMVCPVCGPAMVRAAHPGVDWHAESTWAVVKANGEHGK